jgi:hypothetical protein
MSARWKMILKADPAEEISALRYRGARRQPCAVPKLVHRR